MPPRTPAHGRRPSSRRAAPVSNIGLCISDAVLIHAIAQHQKAASETCRRINSHAGPLESRRRASKRRMTGLMPTSHAFPPIWKFDVGPRTMQWEAPTSVEHRRQKRKQWTVSSVFNTFIAWLENLGSADKISPSVPGSAPSETISGVVRSEALAVDKSFSTGLTETTEEEAQRSAASTWSPEEIVLLRRSVLDIPILENDVNGTEFYSKLYETAKICKRSLRLRLQRGELSAQGLAAAFEPFDEASRAHIPTADMAHKISAMIRRGILWTMDHIHREDPEAIAPELWLTFLDKLLCSSGDTRYLRPLRMLLTVMPASLKEHISAEKIRSLTCRVVTAQARRLHSAPPWLTCASIFSRVLQQLPAQQQWELDDAMAAFLSERDSVSEEAARSMRYAWLLIKAHTAHTSTQDFIDLYRTCLGPDERLCDLRRWQVLYARQCALQTFDRNAREHLETASRGWQWPALLSHIVSSTHKTTALQDLVAFLTAIDEFSSSVSLMTALPLYKLRRETIEALATACAHHTQALHLYDTIEAKLPPIRSPEPLWQWTTWTQYVEAIIKDPSIKHHRLWQVLKLSYNPRGMVPPEASSEDNTAKARLVMQMAEWYLQTEHLTERGVLRNLQRCLNMYRALKPGTAVPYALIACIVKFICRDLERGGRGRTSRMKWVLDIVAEDYGEEEARKMAVAWEGRRWMNDCERDPTLRMGDWS
ncbi:hypothetical protein E4U13_004549 [Claviceps humidiphila]|uniref:Uncharacterized protein n=1 Tax=Claviceps humidiphila TaxID=1294629 RepID=A0A9P7Q8K9_9HYPO|nr:hypothetical protein E4U13_004549 [Claviceps humidiphila]